MRRKTFLLLVIIIGLVASLSACAGAGASSAPTAPIDPITISEDLTSIDLCQAIPQEDIEAAMGVQLAEPPTRYTLRNAEGSSGCYYEGPTDSDRERHFGYVVLTPLEVYDNQTLFQNEDVPGIGNAAYFNQGRDARQLWVKVDDKVAFVVTFGDVAKEQGAKAIAKLMVEAIK
jgi:hypothetical protein